MKTISSIFFIGISILLNAQELKSSSFLNKEIEVLGVNNKTDILITESEIILKNFLENHTKDDIKKIERIEIKPYNGIKSTWYYCISTEMDIFRNEYRKSIFIYDKVGRTLLYADFASEVDIYWKKFLIDYNKL
ncbi:hypothetical protein SAMN05443634_101122 [Chishuiella changwenlii]|uniref:Uncharacterized protein n=1 Tax=Chishuiella changwenlii TaxID=1434701 RepID=A0A1M6SU21_9FLAO|nr:hypothetical protein [Chishuiella changwenlii]GGF09276.1 hypothetical protein GCM10010984_28040 [Chishuiella changwenlii]SHK48147.1 hypothetical protein SAMN05443634_101122 [Chishuiella changwenlii]